MHNLCPIPPSINIRNPNRSINMIGTGIDFRNRVMLTRALVKDTKSSCFALEITFLRILRS